MCELSVLTLLTGSHASTIKGEGDEGMWGLGREWCSSVGRLGRVGINEREGATKAVMHK